MAGIAAFVNTQGASINNSSATSVTTTNSTVNMANPAVSIYTTGPGVYGITVNPQAITVVIGTNNTVTWTDHGTGAQSIVSATGLFSSGLLFPGQSYTYTFTQAGTYAYHGTGLHKLIGVVIVENP